MYKTMLCVITIGYSCYLNIMTAYKLDDLDVTEVFHH